MPSLTVRTFVGVRLSETGLAVIDQMARDADTNRSEMIRTLLAEAVQARQAKAHR